MAGIAALAKSQGHKVTGCDQNVYPPMSTQLNKLGIKRYGIKDDDYEVLSKAFKILRKGEDLAKIEPITEDLQYLISWFSVKSERGHHSFI